MTDISLFKIPPAPSSGPTGQTSAGNDQPTIKIKDAADDRSSLQGPREPADPLNRAAQILEEHFAAINGMRKKLTLEKDESAGVVVYRAIDRDTGEVIKQFPPDSLLKLLSYYRSVEGMSFNDLV